MALTETSAFSSLAFAPRRFVRRRAFLRRFQLRRLSFTDRNRPRRNRRILVVEPHHRSGARHRRQVDRVPVRQADAAVGLGLSDVLRVGRAVDPIGRGREIDPDQADRIVRTLPDGELPFGLHPFPRELRIVMVLGIPGDADHLEDAARRGLLLAAHRRRIEAEELAVPVVGAHVARRLVHHDRRRDGTLAVLRRNRLDRMAAGGELHLRHVGHDDLGSGALEIGARVEPLQQAFGHMEFLGDLRRRARVRKAGEPRHRFQFRRDDPGERPGDVRLGDRIGLQDRRRTGGRELIPGRCVEAPGDREPVDLLKGADGFAEVVSVKTVDCAGRETGPIEQRFGLGDQRRILVVRAVRGGGFDRSGSHWARDAGRRPSGGGGDGADEEGGGERGGEQAKHCWEQPLAARSVPGFCIYTELIFLRVSSRRAPPSPQSGEGGPEGRMGCGKQGAVH